MPSRLMSMCHGTQTRADLNLVTPLTQKVTVKRIADTNSLLVRSGAVSPLIGANLRQSDVHSVIGRSSPPTTGGFRTSTMAIRTTTTRTSSSALAPSADTTHAGFNFTALVQAYYDCRKHKRNTLSALAFEQHLEENLGQLFEDLISGRYTPGRSICFVVTRPKAREVWAADFRDRIVHHFLYNAIGPRFESSFIADSCACIKGRGTLYAVERLESKIRSITHNWSKPAHYLKLDLANFFVSIDKRILWEQLQFKIAEPEWLNLTETVLWHDPRDNFELRCEPELFNLVPVHKRLGNQPTHLGLPIGNLSSQFFANVYLNALDQFVKHKLHCKYYARYVDDFILLHDDPKQLSAWKREIEEWLPKTIGSHVNPSKTIEQPISRGIDFVGHVIKPWRRTIRKRTINDAIQRIKSSDSDQYAAINSYFGMATQATHSHNDRVRIAKATLSQGHAVNWELTKCFRQKNSLRSNLS